MSGRLSILMRRANSEYVSTYVCLFEAYIHTRLKALCMYVWQAQASMYVCLRLLSKYVFMSHSKLQNLLVSEGVKFLIKTYQNLMFNWFLCWIVRDGTSRSPARLQTCMYVCLSSRRTLSMYVCMSDSPKQVCMYVWGSWACMYVCMYVSLKATKSACFGGCQIPYQNLSKSDV